MSDKKLIPELIRTEELQRPYSIHGRRCYMVGWQDGLFRDLGWHRSNEMGGIWVHPLKIADGIWISVETGEEEELGFNPIRRNWLRKTNEFVIGEGGAWVEHRYDTPRWNVTRREFVPKEDPAIGFEVQVTPKDPSVKVAQLNVLIRFDILPAWMSGWPDPIYLEAETTGDMVIVHGASGFDIPYDYCKWAAALGWDTPPARIATGESLWGPERTQGNGISCLLKFPLDLNPTGRVRFVLSGDHEGEKGAINVVNSVISNWDAKVKEKSDWYNKIASDMTLVKTPDEQLNDAFLWSKMNLEWVTQGTPCVGTAVVAGYQDYTSYFGGDTEVSIRGMLGVGLHETAKESLRMLGRIGMKANGKIPHEYVSSGAVPDPGGAGETGLFAQSVWDTYLWTGDEEFLKESYPICRKGMMEYILSEPTKDGLILIEWEDKPGGVRDKCNPAGIGMGFRALANMAERLGDTEIAAKARGEQERITKQVEDYFWCEKEGYYIGMLDDNNQPIIPNDDGWHIMKDLYCNVGYAGLANKARIERQFVQAEDTKYSTEYGVMLHYTRDEIMPVTTGYAAVSELNYDRRDKALEYVRMMANCVGHIMPGAIPEVLDPHGDATIFRYFQSPHWNYLQLWSAAFLEEGLLWMLLKPEPDAAKGTLTLTPWLPADWPSAEVTNLTVGRTRIRVKIEKGKKTTITHIDGPKLEVTVNEG
ncbi:MAG: glycosyl hydrolase family 65 protein [bacterium]